MKVEQFTIVINSISNVLKYAPIGWESRNRSIVRSDESHGVFREFTNDIVFIKDGYKLLKSLWETDGWNAIAHLKSEHFNNKTGQYELESYLKLDFTTFSETTDNGKGIKIALTDNEFTETLQSRKDTEIPYDRLTTVDDAVITPFDSVTSDFGDGNVFTDADGYRTAKIFGIDVADKGVPYTIDDAEYGDDGSGRNQVLEINTKYKNEAVRSVTSRKMSGSYGGEGYISQAITSDCFYYTTGKAYIKYNINVTLQHRSNMLIAPDTWEMHVMLYKIAFDEDGDVIVGNSERIFKHDSYSREWDYNVHEVNNIVLNPNEGLVLVVYHYCNNSVGNEDGYIKTINSGTISVDFSEKYDTSYNKFILPHEVFSRVLEGITGQSNCLYAPIFGRTDLGYDEDGEFAYFGVTKGLLIRGFPTGYKMSEDDDTKVAQISFTFNKLFKSFDVYCCLGWSIIEIDGALKVFIGKRDEFYNQNIIAQLPKMVMKSFTKEANPNLVYNNISIGCDVESYKEMSGLEEYNGTSKFATIIKPVDNLYDLVADYKNNVYAIEYARRKPFASYSTTDTQYDDDIQIVCLVKDENGNLIQLTDEGFNYITGIPLVKTPMNLDITPSRSLLRHGSWINIGLYKYPSKLIKYASSSFVTGLGTQKNSESEVLFENADILNTKLGSALLSGMVIKANISISNALWNVIIENRYGIFEFTDMLTGQTIYGAIKSITNEPVKNEPTNIELWEAFPPDVGTVKLLTFDDDYVMTYNDGYVNEIS